jgi:hypothetical protein
MGHIINLSAQSFLFVTDKENIKEAQVIKGISVSLVQLAE